MRANPVAGDTRQRLPEEAYQMKQWLRILLAVWGFLLMGQMAIAEPRVLRFATYATERPSEEFRKMEPFRKALEDGLRERGLNVRVVVRIIPTYEEGILATATGRIDIARLGPVSYVLTKQRNPHITLLAVEEYEGKKSFFGLIIVGKDAQIQNLEDLRGKRMAFGNPNSTTGRYLAQGELAKAGIGAKDFLAYDYLGRHDKVVFSVGSGLHDAGACNEVTFEKYAKERNLRELARFKSPTHGWVARSGLEANVTKAIRDTLLAMKGEALDSIDRNGFLPGTDSDYDELRKSIKSAQEFGG